MKQGLSPNASLTKPWKIAYANEIRGKAGKSSGMRGLRKFRHDRQGVGATRSFDQKRLGNEGYTMEELVAEAGSGVSVCRPRHHADQKCARTSPITSAHNCPVKSRIATTGYVEAPPDSGRFCPIMPKKAEFSQKG